MGQRSSAQTSVGNVPAKSTTLWMHVKLSHEQEWRYLIPLSYLPFRTDTPCLTIEIELALATILQDYKIKNGMLYFNSPRD